MCTGRCSHTPREIRGFQKELQLLILLPLLLLLPVQKGISSHGPAFLGRIRGPAKKRLLKDPKTLRSCSFEVFQEKVDHTSGAGEGEMDTASSLSGI